MTKSPFLLAPFLSFIACSSPEVSSPVVEPGLAWPEVITLDRLPEGWVLHGYEAPVVSISEAAGSGGIERQGYWAKRWPLVIEVIATETTFYLHSDCMQGHYDHPVGPFAGDPRVILDAALPCLGENFGCDPVGFLAGPGFVVGAR